MLLGRDPNISSMSVKNLSAPRTCTIDIARHTDSVRETRHLYNFKYRFDTSSKSYISSLQVNCIKFTDTSRTISNFHYILKHLNILYIIWISIAGNVKIWICSMGVTLTMAKCPGESEPCKLTVYPSNANTLDHSDK